MLTPEIQNYISQQRSAGVSDDQIRQNLVGQGWGEKELKSVLKPKSTFRKMLVVLNYIAILPWLWIMFGSLFIADNPRPGDMPLLKTIFAFIWLMPIFIIVSNIISWRRKSLLWALAPWIALVIALVFLFIIYPLFSMPSELNG